MLPKMSAYVRSYDDQTKLMYLFTEDDDFTEKYNTIWDVISALISKNNLIENLPKLEYFENQNKILQ